MTALDRLAEKHGPGSDKTHPLFAALWEDYPNPPPGTRSHYVRRPRAEAESRLLEAAMAAGYRGVAVSLNDDGSWEADIEGTVSPPTGASIRTADDPYEALAAALLAAEGKP